MIACRYSEMGASGPLNWQSVAMESDELTGSVSTPNVGIREYASADYSACRMLWVELTEHHRRIYEDPSIGGDDPGGAFDDVIDPWQQS